MEWALNPIKEWSGTPTTFVILLCHYCTSVSRRQVTVACSRVYGWVDDYLSPLVILRVLSSNMNANIPPILVA